MKPRERVLKAINHQETDRVPVDFGGTGVSGMHASAVFRLRRALGLPTEGAHAVKVIDPFQMLGEVADDLREALELDVAPVMGTGNVFGFENKDWKPWRLFDGTPVLVPGLFNTEPDQRGDILMYPQGDRSAPPSGRMPKGGFYFDAIVRQPPIVESALDPKDNLEGFSLLSDAELEHFRREATRLYRETDYAVASGFPGTNFGSIGMLPGMSLKHPRGIRSPEEWFVSLASRHGYIHELFQGQCEIAMKNLELFRQAVLDNVQVVIFTGTDFGTQRGPILSPKTYRELYKPFSKCVNDWAHAHTRWKTMMHSCGAVEPFIEDFIEASFDILNPVQCSAAGMDPQQLKEKYGARIAFWGGGVDTQKTLPFGTPDEVRREVQERVRIFSKGGGYVFNAVHNVQAKVPAENLLAMFEALDRRVPAGRGA